MVVVKVVGEAIVPSQCKSRLGVTLNPISRCKDLTELISIMASLGFKSNNNLRTAAIRRAHGLNIPSRIWVEAEVARVKQLLQTITTIESTTKVLLCLCQKARTGTTSVLLKRR